MRKHHLHLYVHDDVCGTYVYRQPYIQTTHLYFLNVVNICVYCRYEYIHHRGRHYSATKTTSVRDTKEAMDLS